MCDALAKGIIMQGGKPHEVISSPYDRPAKRQKVMIQLVLYILLVYAFLHPHTKAPNIWR